GEVDDRGQQVGITIGEEPEADAAYGDDAATALGLHEPGPEATHLHVEALRVAHGAPQLPDQPLTGYDLADLAHQQVGDVELTTRAPDLRPVDRQLATGAVQHDRSHDQEIERGVAHLRRAPDERAHARDHLVLPHRLEDHAVDTDPECVHAVA